MSPMRGETQWILTRVQTHFAERTQPTVADRKPFGYLSSAQHADDAPHHMVVDSASRRRGPTQTRRS